jgi:hypothetical protein
MLIIVLKVPGTNAWAYPDLPKFFKSQFRNPADNSQLICENKSGKTLAELTAQAGYSIVEYVGDTPVDAVEKLVSINRVLKTIPRNTARLLENIRDNANYNTPSEADDGDTARLILNYLLVGEPININSETSEEMFMWMISRPELSVTQAHFDELKAGE